MWLLTIKLIPPKERRWVWRWVVVLGVLVGWPVLWGLLSPPEGWRLYRAWTYGGDYTQYRAAMAQGFDGAWLIVNRFTPEPHRPVLQYPLYVLLGHGARALHLPLEVPYALAAAAAIVALAFALYAVAAALLPSEKGRRLAFWLALSVGPAWLISAVQALIPPLAPFLERYRNAFNRPEVNTFLLFSAPPHLPLALALLLFSFTIFYRQRRGHRPSTLTFLLGYVLSPLALGLLNPFSLPTLLLPLGLWWLVRSLQARRVRWRAALPLVVMGLAALPLVLYNLWTFSADPFWGQAYGSQNYQISFPIDVVLVGYGGMGLLAIVGAVWLWRRAPERRRLPFCAVVILLMGYLPLRYQRRFSLGLGPLLAVLAAVGWRRVARTRTVRRWWHRAPIRVVGSALLVLILWGQNLMFYYAYAASFMGRGPTPYAVFQPRALAAAADHLNGGESDVVVLTCEDLGNLLAGELDGRVVLGHAGATLNVAQRRERVAAFFEGRLAPADQTALLQRHGVTHVLTSAVAPLACGPAPATVTQAPWTPVFDQGGIRIYARDNPTP
jgi:hypothetical protein